MLHATPGELTADTWANSQQSDSIWGDRAGITPPKDSLLAARFHPRPVPWKVPSGHYRP